MPNLNELLRLSELQDFGSQAEADAWFAEQEAAGRREADRNRQRRFRERRTAYADQGRRFVELVGRAPADEIELRVAEVAEQESITFSEALDRVLRDDPTAYREPDSDDDTHETTLREGNAAIDDAWLERAESLREDDEPLEDALRRAFHEWLEEEPEAVPILTVQKAASERLEAAEPTKDERTAEVEDELLALAEKRRQSGQSLRDAIDAVVASPEGTALMQRVKKARGSA